METEIPLVVFAFNRPKHLKKLFDSLKKNYEAKITRLIVYIDGPRTEEDINKIELVKDLTSKQKLHFSQVECIQRPQNFGCKKNVIIGVTETFSRFEAAVFLEDDLIVGEYFLNYMFSALSFYKNKKPVYHICGFSFIENDDSQNAFFSRYMNCWGWGTWKDRWESFDNSTEQLEEGLSAAELHKFNIESSHDFFRQLTENRVGLLDTWAIFWYATIFKRNGLCLTPPRTLIVNNGNDGSGERTGKPFLQASLSKEKKVIFPTLLVEDQAMVEKLRTFFNTKNNIIKNFVKAVLYSLPFSVQKYLVPILVNLRNRILSSL